MEADKETAITRRDEPTARLIPEPQGGGFASLAGAWRGQVKIADDFDDLPDDLAEALIEILLTGCLSPKLTSMAFPS